MECYSVIKKKKIMSFAGKWIEIKVIMLSEINQTQKDKYHASSLICGTLKDMKVEWGTILEERKG
jgi:hypothetical protein